MDYKAHITLGAIFVAAIYFIDALFIHFFFVGLSLQTILVFSPLLILSFVIPDIDHQNSKVRLMITIGLLVIAAYLYFISSFKLIIVPIIILLVIWVVPMFDGWGHRGHAHSLIFIGALAGLVALLNWKIAILFFFGAFSHFVFDGMMQIW